MSDSGDDWFEKDIDEIVQEVQKKKELIPSSSSIDDDEHKEKNLPKLIFEDYGGNYELPKPKDKKTKSNKDKNKQQKSEKSSNFHGLSFKKLSFISELSPLNVFLEVTQNDCGFFECLDDNNLSDVFLILVVKVLSKLFELPFDEFKKEFISVFNQSTTLLSQIKELITSIFVETVVKNKKQIFHININEVSNEIVLICKNIQKYNLITNDVKNLIKSFLDVVNKAGSKFTKLKTDLNDLYQIILNDENNLNNKSKEIYPTLDELKSEEIEQIKPNIIKGKYDSIKHYLDIHKSLLREDFVIPLRDTIKELRSVNNLDKISMTKVYKKVKFIFNDQSNSKNRKGEMCLVDLKPDQRIVFSSTAPIIPENIVMNPKALMFGSLLCFTTSLEFNDLILAVVSNRDPEMISKGYIHVEIIKLYNIGTIFENEFIMLESEVYFEPYHQVYQVLKRLDANNFPMVNYIVSVDTENHLPDYLLDAKKSHYNFDKYTFDPLDHQTYPIPNKLNMNESQLEAFKHALTHKFSLIQGPPGTGKTYIGLKIISALLQNVDSQILIICYTNHALDQFLSGILKMTTDVVRIGNQSKDEQLDKYNIKQMTDSIITDRRLKACFYNTKNEYMKKLQEFEAFQKDNKDKSEENYNRIQKIQAELRRISRKLEELKQISEYNLINDKKIIGMTTTSAARCNILLQLLKTPIVLIEEAAEILESHIIASITKETQHVILIGDHQQLRPTTSVYKMSQKYKMHISLFERMINNNLNCVCLSVQHRMREEIADLLRLTIYKDLKDDNKVQKYNDIKGVAKNLYFINHNNLESELNDETTKKNIFEAQFLVAFANYLIMQGYKPNDIILLTTYNGQMIQILNEKKHYQNLLKVKVTVVDNFQGEERKIVLLSLVRSNKENRIGYLGFKNRICVALSRAKEGFYMIGNMDLMSKNSDIWNEINKILQSKQSIGESLPLKCDQHGMIMKMKSKSDFEQVKYGGCQECCGFTLQCGHSCGYMCHWDGFKHSANCECR